MIQERKYYFLFSAFLFVLEFPMLLLLSSRPGNKPYNNCLFWPLPSKIDFRHVSLLWCQSIFSGNVLINSYYRVIPTISTINTSHKDASHCVKYSKTRVLSALCIPVFGLNKEIYRLLAIFGKNISASIN